MSAYPPPEGPGSLEGVLADLVGRGLLGPRDVARAVETEVLAPLDEWAPGGEGSPLISSFGLRNLTVLNQLYGAGLGDLAARVLRAVVSATGLEAGAVPARGQGPDVLLLHRGATRGEAEGVVRRIREIMAAVALPAGGGSVRLRPLVATVELGAAARCAPGELLRALREARFMAGRSDEGTLYLPERETAQVLGRLRERDERLACVTEALASGRVEVHFQPVVDLRTGRLADVEALARIPTPRGLLAAGEFIDDVHRLGETAALDGHVMRRVGESAAELARATTRLFVNVSPLSLGSPDFREVMAATIARLRAEGLKLVLVLELTEQALLEHHETIREIHRDHGVTFAVDDFGTGYSSLRTVSDLAVSRVVSVLKIDGSLTRRIAESPEAYKVVLAVAHLAKSLDLRVIAEHVETPEVLERLRTTGIECGQGFLFDPALPAGELLARHSGRGRAFGEPPPRPHLLLLEPYLHRAFEAFYEKLLSDPHFARYFRDEAQVRGLVERQRQTFLESLDDDPAALRARYGGLGRRHAEMGLPLSFFLKGADILHEQLLEVLVHATREPSVLRDTQRFFASLRDLMARGYLEKAVPEARAELAGLRSGAAGAALGPEGREAAFACVDGLLAGVERHLEADELGPGVAPLASAGADACPAARSLVAAGAGVSHAGLHGDAESLAFFLSRAEHAAAFPILEGLLGRFHRLLLAGCPPAPPGDEGAIPSCQGRGKGTTVER